MSSAQGLMEVSGVIDIIGLLSVEASTSVQHGIVQNRVNEQSKILIFLRFMKVTSLFIHFIVATSKTLHISICLGFRGMTSLFMTLKFIVTISS